MGWDLICHRRLRVQQVHEKWVNIRTLLQTKLINILNIHTNPDFKFLAECTEWVHQKLVSASLPGTQAPFPGISAWTACTSGGWARACGCSAGCSCPSPRASPSSPCARPQSPRWRRRKLNALPKIVPNVFLRIYLGAKFSLFYRVNLLV